MCNYLSNDIDWNSIATLVGAIIMAGATFVAVYITSHEDRKARKFENKYSYYINKLRNFEEKTEIVNNLNWYFKKISGGCIREGNKIEKKIPTDVLYNDYDMSCFIDLFNNLCNINQHFKQSTENFKVQLDNLFSIYSFLQSEVIAEKEYITKNKEEKNISFIVNDFLISYKKVKNKDYDANKFYEELNFVKNIINEEFKLEDK